MPTAIGASSVLGLVAVGVFTAQILIGLLLSVGYNPVRQWPRQRVKLFTFHSWLAYIGLTIACTHPLVLLLSSTAGFRLFDILVPIWSATQPGPNTLGGPPAYLTTIAIPALDLLQLLAHQTWMPLRSQTDAPTPVLSD